MSCHCKVISGPCAITWNDTTFLSQGDVTIRANIEHFEIMADYRGKLDARLKSLAYTVSFTPVGVLNTMTGIIGHISSLEVGSDIYRPSGADLTLTINPLTNQGYTAGDAGKVYTFLKAALTGIPSLKLSTQSQLMGDITFTCIRGTGTEQGDANSFWTVANYDSGEVAGIITDAGLTNDTIITEAWEGTWANSLGAPGLNNPWYRFDTLEGFTVSFDRQIDDVKTDNCGFIGSTLQNMSAKITGIPCIRTGNDIAPDDDPGTYGFMEDTLLGKHMFNDESGLAIGASLAGTSNAYSAAYGGTDRKLGLYSSGGRLLTFARACLTGTGVRYGAQPLRQGEVEWTAFITPGSQLVQYDD